MEWVVIEYIYLAQDNISQRARVNIVMNCQVL
jgi:hypothetical protein